MSLLDGLEITFGDAGKRAGHWTKAAKVERAFDRFEAVLPAAIEPAATHFLSMVAQELWRVRG
jgi:hypothetical protein